jgi:lipopolysaccharide transport system permease protein
MRDPNITEIQPSGSWFRLDLSEIWAYRELLFFLTWRDIKIRYKQTAIGVFWVILQPVLTTAIFTIIFSAFAKFDTTDVPYPLFVLSGLLIWLFVHTSVSMASMSFVNNVNLVTKVYFPRLIVPIATTLAGLFDLLIGLAILGFMMIYFSAGLSTHVLFAPLFVLLAAVLAVAFGTLFSALNVRFRDVKFALPFLLQVWMIASPIFYPSSIVPEKWRTIFALNPLTGILEGFRSSLFGTPFDWRMIGISTMSLMVLLVFSFAIFKRLEDEFADTI